MTGDDVCWHPMVGGCFKPSVSHFVNQKNKRISVCSDHWGHYYDELGWEALD